MKFNIVMDITTFKGLMANKISLAQKYLYNNPHEERVTQALGHIDDVSSA